MSLRRALIPALWIACLALASIVVARARYITDLSAFLPAKPTAAQQLLVDQLRDGPASRLILIAVEGADAGTRAQASAALARRLRGDPGFSSVNNGEPLSAERDRQFLFQHRYILSDRVTAARFSATGLRSAIQDTLDDLASSAGLLLKSLLPNDPTGEMMHVIDQLERTSAPSTSHGVWASPDGARALLVAQTAAGGADIDAQADAVAAVRAAFAAAVRESSAVNARSLQLKLSGAGVFAVASRATIERAAVRLSIAGSLLVVTLLFAAYRSLPALALGLMPVVSGALVGIAAVALGFGAVHGITLGFGITLIGESVDYSIYFFVQSRRTPQGAVSPELAAGVVADGSLGDADVGVRFRLPPPLRLSGSRATGRLLDLRAGGGRIGDTPCIAGAAAERFRDTRRRALGCAGRGAAAAFQAAPGLGVGGGVRSRRIGGARGTVPSSGHAVESRTVGVESDIRGGPNHGCTIAPRP